MLARSRLLRIAHRGASGHCPENTRAAFVRAIELGADMVELDCQQTRDGAVVVIHDERLERTTNGQGRVRDHTLREMKALAEATESAPGLPELLGVEGNAARLYFEAFPSLLRASGGGELGFDFTTRSRRPPKDPVNALLSFAYSLLAKDLAVSARAVGLDPFMGFFHQPRHGRPALALDLMEEFRPIIADSVVLSAINTGVVTSADFVRSSLGVAMKPEGRKRFMRAYERRLDEEVTHPVFLYRISYRRILEVQCRLLARHLTGEIASYPEFRTR